MEIERFLRALLSLCSEVAEVGHVTAVKFEGSVFESFSQNTTHTRFLSQFYFFIIYYI